MSSYFRQQLEDWLKTIDVKADRVLDVGGGANPVKGRTKSWDVKEYKILDNGLEEMKCKPDYIADLNKDWFWISTKTKSGWDSILGEENIQNFDVVFCLEVMDYVWDPHQALFNLNWSLKTNGILYISFPFIYPHHNPEGHDYLRYTRWGVEKLLKEVGFKIEELKSRVMTLNGFENWKEFIKNEKMHLSKNYQGHNEIGYLVKVIKK